MPESTRPWGAPTSGDGGIEGNRGPVPSPSSGGSRRGDAALFSALFDRRQDEPLLFCTLRRRREVLRSAHGILLLCGGPDPLALGRVVAARVHRGALVLSHADAALQHSAVVLPCPTWGTWQHALAAAAAEAGARGGLAIPRPPVQGLRALRAAYFAALTDAALALALDATGPVVTERDLLIPRMLAGLSAADQQLLLECLRPVLDLPESQRTVFVRTLDALHRYGGTQSGAAAALHVHPNTVRYRMDRIETLTGMRLDDPRDRLRLDLAALLVVLRGDPPERDLLACFARGDKDVAVTDIGDYCGGRTLAAALNGSDELARVLAGMDGEVWAEGDHLVARPQRDHLGQHRRADQRLQLEGLDGLGVDREQRRDGDALTLAAPRLGEAGGTAVAAAGVARLEGVVALATDLADLDGPRQTVSTHAWLSSSRSFAPMSAARRRDHEDNAREGPGVPLGREHGNAVSPPVDILTRP